MNTDKVRENLNHGLNLMRPETLSRLADARNLALSHYQAHQLARDPVFAGHFSIRAHQPKLGVWLPLVFLVLGILAITYWNGVERSASTSELDVDAAILADDLPVPALTDQRFESWIKRSQP